MVSKNMHTKYYLILLFFLLHLSSVSSSSQDRAKLPSEVHGVPYGASDDNHGTNTKRPSSKIGHAGASTGVSAMNGNNGGPRSPNGQGGATATPVYGKGSASMHHGGQQRHHGTAGRNSVCLGLTLSAMALAVTQLYI